MKFRTLASVLLAVLVQFELFALNKEEAIKLFSQANEYYRKGEFSKAEETYTRILSEGYVSKEVLFNLGNVYYRLGEFHKSILFYERAKLIDPFDEDINFNLLMANLRIVDKFQEKPKFFVKEFWENLRDSLSSSQWATIGLISIWFASICFSLFLLILSAKARKIFFLFGVVFLGSFLLTIGLGISRYNYETNHNRAIVISMNSYIKSSPDQTSTDLLIIHQGTQVEILDEIGDWYKIMLPNGNIGWLKKQDVEKI